MPPIPAALLPFVASWTGYREWSPGTVRRMEVPTGRAVLILEFGPPLGVAASSGALVRHAGGFFAGIDDGPSLTEFARMHAGVQVNLTARGACAFVAAPMHQIARQVVDLPALGAPASLRERLAEARDWPARFAVVADFLEARFSTSRAPSRVVLWALDQIDAHAGAVRIDALANELGYSRKHLHACFLRDVGLSPKRYAELRRFHRLRHLLMEKRSSLAHIAAEAGYADQAHLAREARRFSAMSTTALHQALEDPISRAIHALAGGA